ncbi:discoidin domain-containing protein, partial [Mycoplasma sp. CSL7503-lung]|uniref:discoidin domain-containing protein n=1 Tax=Mycoplasma sp. CSL7503-lung TaxID=536372 RepID=UPI0021CED6EB
GTENQGSNGETTPGTGSQDQGTENQGSNGETTPGTGSQDQGTENQGSNGETTSGTGSQDQGTENQGSNGETTPGTGSQDQGNGEGSESTGNSETTTKTEEEYYDPSQLDENGWYVNSEYQGQNNSNNEVRNATGQNSNPNSLFDENETTEYWVRSKDGHNIPVDWTLTISLPKRTLVSKVLFVQSLNNDTDFLRKFKVQYLDNQNNWQDFDDKFGNGDKKQEFKYNPVMTDKVRIINKEFLNHWWRIGTFKVGYDAPLTKETVFRKINITLDKEGVNWDNKLSSINESKITFKVEKEFENEINNFKFKSVLEENNQVFIKYSFEFKNEEIESQYLVATRADFRQWYDKMVITGIQGYDWGGIKLKTSIKDENLTYDKLIEGKSPVAGNVYQTSTYKVLVYNDQGNYSPLTRDNGAEYSYPVYIQKINDKEFYFIIPEGQPENNKTPWTNKILYIGESDTNKPIKYEISDLYLNINKETGEYTYKNSVNNSWKNEFLVPSESTSILAFGSFIKPKK